MNPDDWISFSHVDPFLLASISAKNVSNSIMNHRQLGTNIKKSTFHETNIQTNIVKNIQHFLIMNLNI